MKRVQLGLFMLLWFPVLSLAQTAPASPDQRITATVTVNAPIYVSAPPPPALGPLRTAAIGTVLAVLGEKDGWLQVQFNDPQYGLRVGWLEKRLVRVEDPSLRPTDLSVAAPTTQPTLPTRGFLPPEAAASPQQVPASGRGGFTLLVNLGLGIQQIGELDSQTGLGGANLGIGGFVRPNLAVLGRFSGTNAPYDVFDSSLISGVAGATVQYWVHERFAIEGGSGLGFYSQEGIDEGQGWGLILGASAVLLRGGKHNLFAGFEYAPAFFEDVLGETLTIHNLGFTVGYQFFRR